MSCGIGGPNGTFDPVDINNGLSVDETTLGTILDLENICGTIRSLSPLEDNELPMGYALWDIF